MRRQPPRGKRHVLRWVAVAAVVIVTAGTLGVYLKYRAIYDSINRVTVPSNGVQPLREIEDGEEMIRTQLD